MVKFKDFINLIDEQTIKLLFSYEKVFISTHQAVCDLRKNEAFSEWTVTNIYFDRREDELSVTIKKDISNFTTSSSH